MTGHKHVRAVANAVGICLALLVWALVTRRTAAPVGSLLIAAGGVVALVPIAWAGRAALDRSPEPGHAAWVTTIVHYALMIAFGSAIIAAIRLGRAHAGPVLPFLPELGLAVLIAAQAMMLLAMASLALEGRGAPWAVALSRSLATHSLYRWTRNPMVFFALVALFSIGLWLSSLLLVLWSLALVTPCVIFFLRVYEERELEIRFGAAYREYRQATPMLWPRRPKR
jgi:protein-S-isoprenylcysteine O-methyltransferase Ste14